MWSADGHRHGLNPAGFRQMLEVSYGLAAGRFIGVQLYNKNYRKCKMGKFHDRLMCFEKYDGSSKGMEATGAEKVVIDCFGD
jgi:hypothetical protein